MVINLSCICSRASPRVLKMNTVLCGMEFSQSVKFLFAVHTHPYSGVKTDLILLCCSLGGIAPILIKQNRRVDGVDDGSIVATTLLSLRNHLGLEGWDRLREGNMSQEDICFHVANTLIETSNWFEEVGAVVKTPIHKLHLSPRVQSGWYGDAMGFGMRGVPALADIWCLPCSMTFECRSN